MGSAIPIHGVLSYRRKLAEQMQESEEPGTSIPPWSLLQFLSEFMLWLSLMMDCELEM